MKTSFISKITLLLFVFALSCTDHEPDPTSLTSTDFAGNLVTPFAITKGANDYLWVTEVGTGKNDGQVSAIAPNGKVYPAVIGFASRISPEENLPDGLTHLSYKDGFLYVIQGFGGLFYKIDVSKWKPGDAPISASSLTSEDIGSFVLKTAKETHLYNLAWGLNGDIYFTDAAANVLVKRKANGDLSIFATFDQVDNPKVPLGPPTTDFVPTGIAFDGSKLLVTSLTGFPFNDKKASIKQVDMMGKVWDYKTGFTTLVDVVLTPSGKPLVLSFAKFLPPPAGFQANTGAVLNENGDVLLGNLMMPTDIERTDDKTYYVVSMALSKIIKLTY